MVIIRCFDNTGDTFLLSPSEQIRPFGLSRRSGNIQGLQMLTWMHENGNPDRCKRIIAANSSRPIKEQRPTIPGITMLANKQETKV